MDNKCKYYHIQQKTRYMCDIIGRRKPYNIDIGVCSGTREREECYCGGDETKCNFYPEVREKAIQEQKENDCLDIIEIDKVAEMLCLMFDDTCACNYNGNDEWLPEKCKYAETECPNPKDRLGCWKEFIKHFLVEINRREEI